MKLVNMTRYSKNSLFHRISSSMTCVASDIIVLKEGENAAKDQIREEQELNIAEPCVLCLV